MKTRESPCTGEMMAVVGGGGPHREHTIYIYIYRVYISYRGVHVRRVVYIKHTGERRSWILISLGGLSYLSRRGPPRDPARGTLRVATFGRPFQTDAKTSLPSTAPSPPLVSGGSLRR